MRSTMVSVGRRTLMDAPIDGWMPTLCGSPRVGWKIIEICEATAHQLIL